MTDRKLDQMISDWLEAEAPKQVSDRVLRATFERTRKTRQRVGWRVLPGRLRMPKFAPALATAAIVLVVAVVAVGVYVNRPGIGVKPSPTPLATPSLSVELGIFQAVAGWIVYEGQTGVWAVDPASSDPATTIQLTSEADDPRGWSSDGTRLLIKGDENLFVLDADGSRTQVTERLLRFNGATVSPDGSRVVYAGQTELPADGADFCANGALFAVDADAGQPELLWESREGIVREPTFSPDGTRIAYVDGFCDHRHSVWVMNADGTDAHQIVTSEIDSAGHVNGLAWSPAGDRIALGFSGYIYTFAPDGSEFRQIAGGPGECESAQECSVRMPASAALPYWSSDGSQIAYKTGCAEGVGSSSDVGCVLAIANADGANVRELSDGRPGPWHPGTPSPSVTTPGPEAPSPDATSLLPTPSPTPSPSGSPIADLESLAYGVDGDVFLAHADGSNPVLIADGEPRSSSGCASGEVRTRYTVNGTAWSPDGRYIAYWDWRPCPLPPNGWGTVFISDAEGNVVTSFPGQGWAISWSPDSKRVAVLETWVVEDGQDGTILVYGLDGTRQAALSVPSALWPASGDFSPAWSRDGSAILLPGVRVPLDGGDITPSDESGFYTGCCAYSPDGLLRGAVDEGTLVLEVADKPDSHKVGPTEFWSLAWSPDGKVIAFERFTDIVQGNATELLVRDVATGADSSLFDVPESDSLHVLEFTPDGERILFTWRNGNRTSLWTIATDGSDPRRLVEGIEWADLRP